MRLSQAAAVDTVIVDGMARTMTVHFNRAFTEVSFREAPTEAFLDRLTQRLTPLLPDGYALVLRADDLPIHELIPNAYRSNPATYDANRLAASVAGTSPIIRPLDRPWTPTEGLEGRHLALWHSHGWYYEPKLDRWEWQRARVFQTVEDLLPMAFVVSYLAPMLERAGATVFMPRERDTQPHEVVIDNDGTDAGYAEQGEWFTSGSGFARKTQPYSDYVNPFRLGTTRQTSDASATATYSSTIPENGDYAVYVSYAHGIDRTRAAQYTVHHAGGTTAFAVDQTKGGGTWLYLGHFRFLADSLSIPRITLRDGGTDTDRVLSADAVRLGGGMGTIARNGETSGRPRFVEGARYYLQYAGFPDTLVYNITEDPASDYIDDYRSRGEWVGYLNGTPAGPNKARDAGLGIPIDLSMAFHTDAGFTRSDSTIGTLLIYSDRDLEGERQFPDGTSRLANRDLADMVQTELVNDIRMLYDSTWTRRGLWNRGYSEAVRPNVPGLLLELLSHHNYQDMVFAWDPRFRFDVSRSLYKATLKFLALHYGFDATIQPLPVTHFRAVLDGTTARLDWQPQADPLEPSAWPTQYIVYTRRGDGGFDNGTVVDQPSYEMANVEPGVLYSFKVEALNAGGASFPSEVLAVGMAETNTAPVLIINGFDRVSGPARLEAGNQRGFADWWDEGVPDGLDFHYIGQQYDFDMFSGWQDDDAPGHGASHGTYETMRIAGNNRDFVHIHGEAILAAGYSFASTSDEAAMEGQISLTSYAAVNLLLGEEKRTPWPKPTRPEAFEAIPLALQITLRSYAEAGGRLLVSGAYVSTDLFEGRAEDDPSIAFATEVLQIQHRTNYAAQTGKVIAVDSTLLTEGSLFTYNVKRGPDLYRVEAPDALEPANSSSAQTIFRYAENTKSAGVAFRGDHRAITLGFPFEAIPNHATRHMLMRQILNFLLGP
ncbi:MAG: xanthan lyase [Rhodothermales bacterium]